MIDVKFLNFLVGLYNISVRAVHHMVRKKLQWYWRILFVATLLIISLSACGHEVNNVESPESSNGHDTLPKLPITYDFNSGNPWTKDSQLQTLPVFKNLAYTDILVPVYLNKDDLRNIAQSTARSLALEIVDFAYVPVTQNNGLPEDSVLNGDEISYLTAKTKTANIYVKSNGNVSVWFNEPLKLPADYNFTNENTSYEEAMQVLDFLSTQYSNFLNFIQPEKITWVDYHFDGGHSRYYQIYDGAGNLTEKILNYNFNSVFFTPNQHGLWIIKKNNRFRSSQKIGDYPIITADQARDLLLEENYISPVPEEELIDGTIKDEHIIDVELIYRVTDRDPFFLPYYCFVVKTDIADNIPEELEYGNFYVPAMRAEYLTDFPLWDGTINQ